MDYGEGDAITKHDWAQWLGERAAAGLTRRLRVAGSPQGPRMRIDGREYLAFCSNDYLGLANDPRLAEAMREGIDRYGVGAGSAHLINGHFEPHQRLEDELASWLDVDAARLFSTGYMANLGVVGALMGRGDTVIADRLNHASLVDAVQLSGARLSRYRHNDLDDLEARLERARGERMILTDGVFSMDGDVAPLAELVELAERFDAWLVVDEAHAFGVLGAQGRGSFEAAEQVPGERVLRVGTLGKAFGTAGAFVAGAAEPLAVLLQRARTYLFTTAQPPAVAEASRAALAIVRDEGWRRDHLAELVRRFRAGVAGIPGLEPMPSSTPIQPLTVGEADRALAMAERLDSVGLLVPAIRPPTVPVGGSRLRVTLSAAHERADLEELLSALRACTTIS
ncbi:8-amino-7-oxononanoate synthase [Guyparkeria sp. SCN-R1]|uniref:8-amino-7-oxononanoate synthase n=1 Tax=Guyparkeria sp. SCN-R1 TaxID=2341113 RepID=UPI000F64F5AA|nr:8-amino-7-oxononanoate synthase [Guyparkeria sp. SCN-R1]RRQ24584.1 8-amino-7-oxononanoate synthase [Guyparkeria sp. SCN-R1]